LHGRADIQARFILKMGLQIDPDDTPPRHANIFGWPELKEERKSMAQELAAKAALRLQTNKDNGYVRNLSATASFLLLFF